MRILLKIIKWVVVLVVVLVVAAAGYLYFAPPDLIRVASAYSAKIVCSNVFVAGRDAGEVLADDVQAPGHPILTLIDVSVDREAKTVSAGLFGLFGKGLAVARDGYGCATVPDGNLAAVPATPAVAAPAAAGTGLWPDGETVQPSQDPAVAALLDDPKLTGPGMRAVVVVHNGRIIGERYGKGFDAKTPLLGWSMTKSVNAALVGTLVRDGKLKLDQAGLFPEWSDDRKDIKLSDLTSMSSGLEFNEDYGDVTDVTRMLYLEPDMAAFAASKPLVAKVGEAWNYSTGTTVLISKIWQGAAGADALALPRKALFGPIGMTSAVLEADARNTIVGSSYLYATGHDWARFGQLMLNGGEWKGTQVVPADYVAWMHQAAAASKGEYGMGQVWLHGPAAGTPEGEDPDKGFDIPDDAFWFLGHDGQSIAVIPSKRLVVVRLGLTPSKLAYKSQGLVEALAKVVPLVPE
ncbi:MAG: serine hydrolase domain-containing protein [Rhizobiaceae bacterium]